MNQFKIIHLFIFLLSYQIISTEKLSSLMHYVYVYYCGIGIEYWKEEQKKNIIFSLSQYKYISQEIAHLFIYCLFLRTFMMIFFFFFLFYNNMYDDRRNATYYYIKYNNNISNDLSFHDIYLYHDVMFICFLSCYVKNMNDDDTNIIFFL